MKIYFAVLFLAVSTISWGRLVSPFPSTVAQLSLPNAHTLSENEAGTPILIRGMEPFEEKHFTELEAMGVSRVLIFKKVDPNSGKGDEVAREIARLKQMGFVKQSRVSSRTDKFYVQIPCGWNDFPAKDFRGACRQTVQALRLLKQAERDQQTLFFHCTVGEDRTGYLSGLYEFLAHSDSSLSETFKTKMCHRGYGAGNPQKPYRQVVVPIRHHLTAMFLKMIYKIESGQLDWQHLSYQACERAPEQDRAYTSNARYWWVNRQCEASPFYKKAG